MKGKKKPVPAKENAEAEEKEAIAERMAEPTAPSAVDKDEVRVIERIIESKEIAPSDAFGKLTRSQIDLMKRTIAKGATDDELQLFIQVCKGAQLNPFLKQVFLVQRWDSREGKNVGAIQVSIDGFRSIAESSGAYVGNDDPVFEGESVIKIKKGNVMVDLRVPGKATVTVRKMIMGIAHPFVATARWEEYYPGEKMGFQWHIRPYLMLGKCAEALALRKAFPKLLSGMYEEAELANGSQEKPMQVKADPVQVLSTLSTLIMKADLGKLHEYREKVNMPGEKKYTEEQKVELLQMIDARIEELSPKKEDDGIPVIHVEES